MRQARAALPRTDDTSTIWTTMSCLRLAVVAPCGKARAEAARAALGWAMVSMASLGPQLLHAQRPVVATATFTPASHVLFFTDFTGDPLGSFPKALRHVSGPVDVVDVGGRRMLRSTGPSEFVIPLQGRLPQDFTLEFEFVPRGSQMHGGEELTFEGGAQRLSADDDLGSAWVLWNQMLTRVRGGGSDGQQVLIPEEMKGDFAGGQVVSIQVSVTGSVFRLFTNGRLLHNLPNLAFRRAPMLRVTLGGVNDQNEAVFLASIRVATGAAATTVAPAVPGAATTTSSGTTTSSTTSSTGGLRTPPAGASTVGTNPVTRSVPQLPAPFNQSSSLPNVPPPGQPAATSSSALAGSSALPVAGPSQLGVAFDMRLLPPGAFGVALAWPAVPNAVTYRVYRGELGGSGVVPIHLTIPASDATAVGQALLNSGSTGVLIDPYLTGVTRSPLVYWVDATLADGSVSSLSPNAMFDFRSVAWPPIGGAAGPPNLNATVGPPTTVNIPNGSLPGRNVTWTWDPLALLLFEVDVMVSSNLVPGGWVPFHQATLMASADPVRQGTTVGVPLLSPLGGRGHPTGPPYTVGIPSGHSVQFCVGILRTDQTVTISPGSGTCITTLVP